MLLWRSLSRMNFLSELQWGTCRCMYTVQYAYTCTLYLYVYGFFCPANTFFSIGRFKGLNHVWLATESQWCSALHVFLLYQYQNPWFQLSSFLFIYFMLGEMSLCLCHAIVDITAVTLHGYEWLTYQLYSEEEKTLRDRNRFSLQFKVRETIPKLITLNTPRFSLFFPSFEASNVGPVECSREGGNGNSLKGHVACWK